MTVCDRRGGLGHTVTTSSAPASPNRGWRVIPRAENYVICQELCVSKISCSSPAEAELVAMGRTAAELIGIGANDKENEGQSMFRL